ncbi:MAG: gliding motility-associated C-terminal domain-containing protein, partial [Flavobacteriales bacterium]|nr:gliding motility-associated C-terminal domain-containing protein [Flavobacteriales bacterium]
GPTGSISYHALSPFGCPSDTLIQNVTISGSFSINAGINDTICIGDTVNLSATVPLGTQISWAPTNSISNPNISNPDAFPVQQTTYILTATDSANCTVQDSVEIIVENIPNIVVSNDTNICAGDSIQLFVSTGVTYSWSPANLFSDPNISNPMATADSSVELVVFITDSTGCGGLDTVNVQVQQEVHIVENDPIWYCEGDSANISVSDNSVSVVWSPSSFLSSTNQVVVTTTANDSIRYFVSITDAIGCVFSDSIDVLVDSIIPTVAGLSSVACIGDTFVLGGNPTVPGSATSVSWSPNTFFLDPDTVLNPRILPTSGATYIVSSVNGQCIGSDSITISLQPKPNINSLADITSCAGADITFTSTDFATNYTWLFGDGDSSNTQNAIHSYPDTGIYEAILIIGDSLGCTNSDTMLVNLNVVLNVNAVGDTNLCEGQLTNISVTGNANSYSWLPVSGLDDANSTNPLVNINTSTTYIVTGIDTNSCTASDTVSIVILNNPLINTINDTTSCAGDSIQLFTSGGGSYLWTPNSGLSNPNVSNPKAFPLFETTYTVQITDTNSCIHIDSTTVSIGIEPTADFEVWVEPSCDDIKLKTTNSSLNGSTFEWIYGTTVFTDTILETDYNSGVDSLILIAYSGNGCLDSLTLGIVHFSQGLEQILRDSVPNVFSPNFDGINEWFEIPIRNSLHSCTELKVYNRWGQLLFTSIGNNHTWNGFSFDGEQAPEGTYFYILTVNGLEFNGSLTLIR